MQKIADPPVTACETCAAPVQRVFHPIAVHFKGSGFYNTDYGTSKRKRELDASAKDGADKHDAKSKDKKESVVVERPPRRRPRRRGGDRATEIGRAARRVRARLPRGAAARADVAVPDPLDAAPRLGGRAGDRGGHRARRRALRRGGRGRRGAAADDRAAAARARAARRGRADRARRAHAEQRVPGPQRARGAVGGRRPAPRVLHSLAGTASNPSTIASWAAIFAAASVAGAAGHGRRRGLVAGVGAREPRLGDVLAERRRGGAARRGRAGAAHGRRDRGAGLSASAARSRTAPCARVRPSRAGSARPRPASSRRRRSAPRRRRAASCRRTARAPAACPSPPVIDAATTPSSVGPAMSERTARGAAHDTHGSRMNVSNDVTLSFIACTSCCWRRARVRSFSLGSRRFLRVRASASACLPSISVSPFFSRSVVPPFARPPLIFESTAGPS